MDDDYIAEQDYYAQLHYEQTLLEEQMWKEIKAKMQEEEDADD
jgi:hypothetical protein